MTTERSRTPKTFALYTNRTCHSCGIRKPQPQMVHKAIYIETGKSKKGVSTATFLGALEFDNRKSKNAIGNWLFNNNQRTYMRRRQVWLCSDCSENIDVSYQSKQWFQLIVFLVAMWLLWWLYG